LQISLYAASNYEIASPVASSLVAASKAALDLASAVVRPKPSCTDQNLSGRHLEKGDNVINKKKLYT